MQLSHPVPNMAVAGVLGLSLSVGGSVTALDLAPGDYTVKVFTVGGLPLTDFDTTVHFEQTVTHTDQYVTPEVVTPATGDLTDNDEPGSSLTTLQIYDNATSSYVDVDAGTPVTVQGLYGSLTVNADGTYTYTPDDTQAHFDSAIVDSFNYQLIHPSGEIAQAHLDVTLEPSGAGVVAPFMAMMSFSLDMISLEDLPVDPADPQDTSSDPANLDNTLPADDASDVDSLLDTYLTDTDASNDNDTSTDTSFPLTEDPFAYLSSNPLDDDTQQALQNVV